MGAEEIEFRLHEKLAVDEWYKIYMQLVKWQLEFDNHKDIEVGETKNGIQKVFVPKKELKDFLDQVQFLQTRNESCKSRCFK